MKIKLSNFLIVVSLSTCLNINLQASNAQAKLPPVTEAAAKKQIIVADAQSALKKRIEAKRTGNLMPATQKNTVPTATLKPTPPQATQAAPTTPKKIPTSLSQPERSSLKTSALTTLSNAGSTLTGIKSPTTNAKRQDKFARNKNGQLIKNSKGEPINFRYVLDDEYNYVLNEKGQKIETVAFDAQESGDGDALLGSSAGFVNALQDSYAAPFATVKNIVLSNWIQGKAAFEGPDLRSTAQKVSQTMLGTLLMQKLLGRYSYSTLLTLSQIASFFAGSLRAGISTQGNWGMAGGAIGGELGSTVVEGVLSKTLGKTGLNI